MDKEYVEWAVENAKRLVGLTVVNVIHNNDNSAYGLELLNEAGMKTLVWVDSDPEGNGVGHLDIQLVGKEAE